MCPRFCTDNLTEHYMQVSVVCLPDKSRSEAYDNGIEQLRSDIKKGQVGKLWPSAELQCDMDAGLSALDWKHF